MCGRMTLTRSGDEIAAYFALLSAEAASQNANGGPRPPRYNIAPTQDLGTVVIDPDGVRRFEWKRWGLVPSWAKEIQVGARLFNARSETAAQKPAFRSAFRDRRCLVPADGFYEWLPRNRGHAPFYFEPAAAPLLALAGLHESWIGPGGEVVDSCTILTTDANADVSDVHHRMPVLVPPAQFSAWLDPATPRAALEALCAPALAGSLRSRPVDRFVNDARRDDPRCLDAPPPAPQPDLFELESEGPV